MARIPGTTKRRPGQVMVGLPVISDDWDEETKNAHALRNATWFDGTCPSCGAEVVLTAFPDLGLIDVSFVQADGCPVTEVLLDPHEP